MKIKPKKNNSKTSSKKSSHYIRNFIIAFVSFTAVSWLLTSPFVNTNPSWYEPRRIMSKDGVLDVTLDAKKSMVNIGGKMQESLVYNDEYPGVMWDVRQGDTIKVHLKNHLNKPTNLHFHGSHVSPKGNSDNVLLTIKPEETFEYEYKLPKDHPPGMYWYHPHFHPDVDDQVSGGMAGAIMVRGDVDDIQGIKDVPERVMVLTTQDGNNPNTPLRLVNGKKNPTMYLRPFETVRLEILNASADDIFNFSIPGYKLHVISRDGNTLDQVVNSDSEHMPPGRRIQVLFTPKGYGAIPVKSLYLDQGFAKYVENTFMTIQVQGLPTIPTALPTKLVPHEDLRNAHVDNVRTLVFSEGGTADNPTFLFDGKTVDMNRVDQIMTLGTTEEWHLVNNSFEMHPFHIHVNPFQVISINGKPVDQHGYLDTMGVPPHGEIVIRTQYKDFDGKFVLHCHILFHEDHGMMQVVEIVKPDAEQAVDNGMPEREMSQSDMDHMMDNMEMGRRKH